MNNMNLCCLIPAFNEENTIGNVIREAQEIVSDVIVVDDGSSDRTAAIAGERGATVISHGKNMGKGMALRTGFSAFLKKGAEAVITIDGDGQHNPAEMTALISSFIEKKGDIIIGARLWDKASIPLNRYLSNRFGVFCVSLASGRRVEDSQSGFRLYKKEVIEKIPLETGGFEAETEILVKAGRAGFRIHSVPVSVSYGNTRKSYFRPVRDFYRISILVLKLSFAGGRK